MKKFLPFLLVFLLIVLVSCISQIDGDLQLVPGTQLAFHDMNTNFRIAINSAFNNSFKNSSGFELRIINISSESVTIPLDQGIIILFKQGKDWEQVQNIEHYFNYEMLVQPESVEPGGQVISITPKIPNLERPVQIRVIIIGLKNGIKTNKVGAYIDLPLKP